MQLDRAEVHMGNIVHLTTDRLNEELRRLEQAHEMSSAAFFARFQAGTLSEHRDFQRWVWLCTVAMRRGLLVPANARA
jgi:hypothetical protein